MVEKGQTSVQSGLQADNSHPRRRKGDVEHQHRRQQEEQQGEQDGPQQQLVQVVVAGVNAVAQDVALAAPEEMEQ